MTDNKNNVEIEVKIVLDQKNLKKLLDLDLIKNNVIKDSHANLKLNNVYYDTKERKLSSNNIVYRIRTINDTNYEATIKTEKKVVGGYSERAEYNLKIKNDTPVTKGFKDLGLAFELDEILENEKLVPLFSVLVNRQVSLIQLNENTKVEMAIDNGEIVFKDLKDDIDEVEFELIEGNKEDLAIFVDKLKKEIEFKEEEKSKFKRGLELISKG